MPSRSVNPYRVAILGQNIAHTATKLVLAAFQFGLPMLDRLDHE